MLSEAELFQLSFDGVQGPWHLCYYGSLSTLCGVDLIGRRIDLHRHPQPLSPACGECAWRLEEACSSVEALIYPPVP